MGKMTEYTLEIYSEDKRIKNPDRYSKNKVGLRFVRIEDFAPVTEAFINSAADSIRAMGYIVEVFETYKTEVNMMSGKEYRERYDTPYFCSPSSETYWSN